VGGAASHQAGDCLSARPKCARPLPRTTLIHSNVWYHRPRLSFCNRRLRVPSPSGYETRWRKPSLCRSGVRPVQHDAIQRPDGRGRASDTLRVEIESTVKKQYEHLIRAQISATLEEIGVSAGSIQVSDRGALDYAIARGSKPQSAEPQRNKYGETLV